MRETDRDRCLEIAKLFEGSWNKLRDFEWKIAFALWTILLIVTAIAVGKSPEIGGIERNWRLHEAMNERFLWWLWWIYWVVGIAYCAATVAIQSSYVYFGRNRDWYIRQATEEACPHLSNVSSDDLTGIAESNLDFHPSGVLAMLTQSLITILLLVASYNIISSAVATH